MRLSRSLLLAGSAIGTDFEVTSCENQTTNAAEMTISVDQAYMELHHQALTTGNGFDLVGGDYIKVIPGSALTLNMEDSTYIYLEHQLVTADEAVPDTSIHFAGRTTTFKCKYPRAVNVGDSYTLPPNVDPSPYVGNGTLHYDFQAAVANGRTTVTINPAHGITSLEANVQNCEVSYDGVSENVYPLRNLATWGDSDVCIDNRIGTNFVYSNGGAVIDWRTFHFNDPNGDANSQEHRITCAIHVSDTLTVSAPTDCSCTTGQQACRDIADGVTYRMPDSSVSLTNNWLNDGPHATGLTIPILYEVKFEMMLAHDYTDLAGVLGFRQVGTGPPGEGNTPPDFSYPNGIPCGARTPLFYVDHRFRPDANHANLFIVSCVSGNSNRWSSNNFPYVWGEWIEVTAGQRMNSNGQVVWYLNVGTRNWEIPQTTPQVFTNVELLIGQSTRVDTTGGSIRNLTLTDMTP